MGLTLKKIAKLLDEPGRYPDGAGLYLQIPEPGKIAPRADRGSWLLRYERAARDGEKRKDGKPYSNGRVEVWMSLGKLAAFTLDEARERARKARQLLADGIDPLDQREANRRASNEEARKDATIPTFEEAAERYFKVHGDKWKNHKHRAQFLSTLKAYAFPKLGALRVNEITTEDVRAAVEPIWKKVPETASRVRGRLESVLSWAIANKYRDGPNPARWSDNLEHLLPTKGSNGANHHAALPYAELPGFWAQLNEREGVAARALEFTILTAARTGETIGGRWDEIDFKAAVWTIPAERMKANKSHRVPLSDRAVEVLKALPRERENEHVFIGPSKGAGLSNMAMAAVLKRMGRDDITVHGMRSTFRDWCAERTNYANHVIEMALAHVIGNKVEAAYRRGDLFQKRVRLMGDWAKFCMSPARSGDVVSLQAGRARR